MKFCDAHWQRLRAAIDKRGLGALVAGSGAEVVERMTTEGAFDPLMAAHNAIVANAMDRLGLALLTQKPDGTGHCPQCTLGEHCAECLKVADSWTDRAADDALEEAVRRGFVRPT